MGINIYQEIGVIRSRMIYNNPVKRRRLHRFYRNILRPGDLCFDIGAHIGAQSATWLDLGTRVIAVEPYPRLFKFLESRFHRHPAIRLVQAAVSDQMGQLELHISSIAPTVSTLADEDWRKTLHDRSSFDVQWDQRLTTRVVTLQHLIEQYGTPAFIKLDVEDFEWQALMGLQVPVPFLSFEYFSYLPDRSTRCIERLAVLGDYEYNVSYREYFELAYPRWFTREEMLAWIANRDPDAHSGDIYARQVRK